MHENAVSATLRTNSVSISKTGQLMLFKEMIAVPPPSPPPNRRTKHVCTLRRQNAKFFIVSAGVTCICPLKIKLSGRQSNILLCEGRLVKSVVSFGCRFLPCRTVRTSHDGLEYIQNFQMWLRARTGNMQAPCPWPCVCWTEGLPNQVSLQGDPTGCWRYRRERGEERQIIPHYVIALLLLQNTLNSACRLIRHYRLFVFIG